MRLIKMAGLAAIAALMAMAFIGASSASAGSTALCKVHQEPCQAGNLVTHVHQTDPKAELVTSILTVKCESLFLGDTLALGSPQVIHGKFTYSNCNGGECTATETSTSALLNVLRTALNLGVVTGEATVKVVCGGFINCTYKGEGLEGHGLGAALPTTAGQVTITNAPTQKVGGFFCPEKASLTTTTTSLEDQYIMT